jgi:hypothetical protein
MIFLFPTLVLIFKPFQFNFSATRILPSSCLFWAGKRLVGYLYLSYSFKREKHTQNLKEYNLRYLLAKVRTTWGKASGTGKSYVAPTVQVCVKCKFRTVHRGLHWMFKLLLLSFLFYACSGSTTAFFQQTSHFQHFVLSNNESPNAINHGGKAASMEHIHLRLRKKNGRGTGRLSFTTGNLKYSIHQEFVTRNGQFHIRFYEHFDAPTSHAAFFISLKFGSNSSGL